jgi:uncharacterized protein (DUF362 family)
MKGMVMFKPRPRVQNVFMRDGKPLVAKVPHLNGDYLQASISEALRLLGGLDKVIQSGDQVMVKPNFNCWYALPFSTALGFLAAVIEILQDAGAKVTLGELSGNPPYWPTEEVVRKLEVMPVLDRYSVPFINFQHDDWIPLRVEGRYWDSFHVPRSIYEADKRVYLANMRCHPARFTASLKLSVGWIGMQDRKVLHEDDEMVEAKIAELNLGWQPNLVLIDGRRSTVTLRGWGEYVYPNVIMASGDMVAIDTEAVNILKQYPEKNRLDIPVEEMGQLKMAQEHGLGSMDYIIVEALAHTRTER